MFIEPAHKTKIVSQSSADDGGCGVATLAMLLGRQYRWAKERYPDLANDGMHVEMLRSLLVVHTGYHWRTSRVFYNRKLIDLKVRDFPQPTAVLVGAYEEEAERRSSHWIVRHFDVIYDPNFYKAQHIAQYSYRDKPVLATVRHTRALINR